MHDVNPFIGEFKKYHDPDYNKYYDSTISKILYNNHDIESDFRALIEKSSQLKKHFAEVPHKFHHSSFHAPDYKSIKENQKSILNELEKLNYFIKYLMQKLPHSKDILSPCVENNEYYLRLYRN
jgi:hypothetical protein